MQPHSKRPGYELAVVDQSLCASCGICAGSCPASTPFRSIEELVSGIEMPQLTIRELRQQTNTALSQLNGDVRILVYGCDHAIDVGELRNSGTAVLSLPCIGMLPPSFIDYALQEGGADGVFITGCAGGDCYYRHGNTWTEQRIDDQREPYLRARVARERIMVFWTGLLQKKKLLQKIQDFRHRLKGSGHD